MPITPGEAKKKRKERDSLAYQLGCGAVDKALIEGLPHGNAHWVACSLIPVEYHDRFVEDYTEAGWNVSIEHDQRDGDAFVLSPKARR